MKEKEHKLMVFTVLRVIVKLFFKIIFTFSPTNFSPQNSKKKQNNWIYHIWEH